MTRIGFYLLNHAQQDRLYIVCRLVEKAYQQGNHIYIYTDSDTQSHDLEHLLWSFRSESFLPHQCIEISQQNMDRCPILISHQSYPPRLMDVLINLTPIQPDFFSQFKRVIEVIAPNDNDKVSARERYRFYQSRGYEIQTHQL